MISPRNIDWDEIEAYIRSISGIRGTLNKWSNQPQEKSTHKSVNSVMKSSKHLTSPAGHSAETLIPSDMDAESG